MAATSPTTQQRSEESQPILKQRGREIQQYGAVARYPLFVAEHLVDTPLVHASA
jgi:hypothetical protein